MMELTFILMLGAWLVVGDPTAIESAIAQTPVPAAALEGSALPIFESVDDQAQPWKSSDHVGRKVLVLYCYPGDFTGGCVRQAQAFREGLAKLTDLGVEVIGISGDEVATHQLFKQSHHLTHALLSDPDGALAERLGIPVQRPAKAAKVRTRGLDGKQLLDDQGKSIFVARKITLPRWTLIVGRDGKLVSKRTNVDPAKDAAEVVKIVEELSK